MDKNGTKMESSESFMYAVVHFKQINIIDETKTECFS